MVLLVCGALEPFFQSSTLNFSKITGANGFTFLHIGCQINSIVSMLLMHLSHFQYSFAYVQRSLDPSDRLDGTDPIKTILYD